MKIPKVTIDAFVGGFFGMLVGQLVWLLMVWATALPVPKHQPFMTACIADFKLAYCELVYRNMVNPTSFMPGIDITHPSNKKGDQDQ